MLSQELRPKTLDDMAGQEEAKRLIKAIIKNPENAPKVLLFCGSFGTGKCVTGDTRVHTSDGYKRIDKLVQNPEYDEEGFMDISPQNIKVVGDRLATHHYYGGKKKVVKISSREFSIKGTPNHRVKVYGGKGGLVWKRLDKITKDDYVAIPIKDVILFDNKSEDYSFFRGGASEFDKGFILGSIFSQSIGNGVDLSEMSDTIDIYGNSASINSFCCRVDGLIEDISYNHVRFSHKDLSKYIYEYGLSHNVPEFVFSSNRKFIVGFLSAFFSFLGDYDFTVSSLSESVARDIQNLLYLLGIVSSVIETSTYKCKLSILHRRSREVFCDTIVISDDIQRVLLRESICNMTSKEEYIPNNTYTKFITARIRHLLRSTALDDSLSSHINFDKWFSFIKYDDRKSLSLKLYHDVLEHANMDIFKDRTLKHFDTLLNTHIFVRVSEIKELSSYDVYDLTVEGTHTFTANGLINHNTTASRIVGRELNNIKDDNYDLLNSPFYYEFDSTVVGNVEEIKKLRDIFTVSFGDYWRIVVLDECVHYDTKIHVMDENGNKFVYSIGRLVSKKPKGWKALSVDDSGNFSYKPILNFFNNGKKDFYKVGIEVSRMGSLSRVNKYTRNVVCTENHRFFDDNFNEVYLRDLKVGDVVSTYEDYGNNRALKRAIKNLNTEYNLNDDVISFLRGSALGDGSLDVLRSGSLRYKFTQSIKHVDYYDVVKHILGDLYCCERVNKSGYGGKDILTVTSCVCDEFKDIFSSLFVDGKKRITREYLDSLTPLSIAVWYMDDGSLIHHCGRESSVALSTHSYSKEENLIIIDYFKEVYDIHFKMGHDKRCDKYYIYVSQKSDRYKFLSLVSDYIIDLFQYKLGNNFKCNNRLKDIVPIERIDYKGDFKFVGKGVIKSITPYKDSHVSAYDIEVADNHNYITSGGVILHNCHTVSATAQAAMLKMFEETKGKTIYILATTDPQKLLPTIRSRALEINFNDVPVEAIVDNLTKVSEERNLNLSEEIKLLIADRSGGHMRNAHMLLDKYILLGEEDFKDSIKSSVTLFCDYLIATYKNDKDALLSNINDLLSIPKDNLQSDWSIVMTESLRSFCGFDCRHKDIKRLVDTYGSDFNIIAQCYMSTWVKNMFVDIPYTQATLLNMYKVVQGALEKKRTQSGVGSVQSVASKYGRPVR